MKQKYLVVLIILIVFSFSPSSDSIASEDLQPKLTSSFDSGCECNISAIRYRPEFCSQWDNGSYAVYSHSHTCKDCENESLCWDKTTNTFQTCKTCTWGYGNNEGGLGTLSCVNWLKAAEIGYKNVFKTRK